MTDPRRWRSDPSRVAAADLLLRAVRRPRPPDADDLARLSKIVCDIPRRAALRKRRVARVIAGVVGLALSASLATSVWAWRRAEDGVARGGPRAARVHSRVAATRNRPREREAGEGRSTPHHRPQAGAATPAQRPGAGRARGAAAVAARFAGPLAARNGAHHGRAVRDRSRPGRARSRDWMTIDVNSPTASSLPSESFSPWMRSAG